MSTIEFAQKSTDIRKTELETALLSLEEAKSILVGVGVDIVPGIDVVLGSIQSKIYQLKGEIKIVEIEIEIEQLGSFRFSTPDSLIYRLHNSYTKSSAQSPSNHELATQVAKITAPSGDNGIRFTITERLIAYANLPVKTYSSAKRTR